MFKIGDKVRMLRSSEEGVVVKVKGDFIDIETTDGFELPVVSSDLVKVSEQEKEFFHVPNLKKVENTSFVFKKPKIKQIDLAFEQVNDFLIRPYFVNHFDKEVFFILSAKQNGQFRNFASGSCKSETEVRIYEDLKKNEFGNWSKWKIDLLTFQKGEIAEIPHSIEVKLRANNIFKEIEKFPFSDKKGFVNSVSFEDVDLSQEIEATKKDPNLFYESYAFNKTRSIDLHAGALGIDSSNPNEIFESQKSSFMKEIDRSIAENVLELTVVHGVGNGHLKTYVHKYLANLDQVEWFKEALKEKFGYGATLVHFKA